MLPTVLEPGMLRCERHRDRGWTQSLIPSVGILLMWDMEASLFRRAWHFSLVITVYTSYILFWRCSTALYSLNIYTIAEFRWMIWWREYSSLPQYTFSRLFSTPGIIPCQLLGYIYIFQCIRFLWNDREKFRGGRMPKTISCQQFPMHLPHTAWKLYVVRTEVWCWARLTVVELAGWSKSIISQCT